MITGDRSRSLGISVNSLAIVTFVWKPIFFLPAITNDHSDCQRSQRSQRLQRSLLLGCSNSVSAVVNDRQQSQRFSGNQLLPCPYLKETDM